MEEKQKRIKEERKIKERSEIYSKSSERNLIISLSNISLMFLGNLPNIFYLVFKTLLEIKLSI